ncbi:unnamed protein product [Calypogeia fissa]
MEMAADPASTSSILLGVVLCGVFTLLVLHYSSLRNSKSGARIPKGSFGWPVIGETLALTRDPLAFALSHRKRYGTIFKSNIFLQKSILGTTPEFAKFVAFNSTLFKVQYPKSVEFVSPNSAFFGDAPRQAVVKKIFRKFSVPEYLPTVIQGLESIIIENLASWEEQGTVVSSDAIETLVADTSSYISLGLKDVRKTPEGRLAVENIITMLNAFGAIPINLPGTAHNKAWKARERVRSFLKSVVHERMKQEDSECDILRNLLEAREKAQGEERKYYEEAQIVDEMIAAWVGSFKTSSSTLKFTVKYLMDYPDAFKKTQAEQLEILEGKDLSVSGPRLTLEDTKKMVYTQKLFQEVQRFLSLTYLIPRKAAEDVVYEGFLIPKGWAVLPMLNCVHRDPAYYEDPESFNPDRFNAVPKPHTYLPFGLGPHRCPGDEITKLNFLIYVHHLTTSYKYERRGPDQGIKNNGFPEIIGGYPIDISRRI